MAGCLIWATVLEAATGPDPVKLAVAFGAWCVAYELSVGSGYFVVVSDLAQVRACVRACVCNVHEWPWVRA